MVADLSSRVSWRLLGGLCPPPQLVFYPAPGPSPFGDRLAESAAAIERFSGGALAVREGSGIEPLARPALVLALGDRQAIHYLALPEGPEAAPFFSTLEDLARGIRPAWTGPLSAMDRPAQIFVFVAPGCPHCPAAARLANQAAAAASGVTTTLIDVTQFPDLAGRFAVRSVPSTVLDERFYLPGVVMPDRLVQGLLAGGEPDYPDRVFHSLLEANNTDRLAAWLQSGSPQAAFVQAWASGSFNTRVALLLAAQTALEASPAALDCLVEGLLPLLGSAATTLRGDTADLLGRIGHPAAAAALEPLRGDPDPDVAEAALEALDAIQTRGR